MKLARRRIALVQLNLSPLIDVIFILLVFVVLIARFTDNERIDVTLPSADAGRPAAVDALMIQLHADGSTTVDGESIAREALIAALTEAATRFDRAVLVTDRDTSLQAAIDIISAAKRAGFPAVAVATQPAAP